MSNSFPKRNLPLRVVLNRVGESTLAQYAVASDPMDSPEAACQLWRQVVAVDPCHESDKEHLVAVLLNAKLRMIGYHVVSVGSLNEALAHPREIFRAAILAGAYGLILMHNHPSDDPSPSAADHRLTKNIREAAGILQINLLDHVIVGSPGMGRPAHFQLSGGGAPMKPVLPNFIFGAIYRTRTGEPDASATTAAYCCYAPAYPDTPPRAYIADCWVCDEFGRIDPGLNVSAIPVRHEDLGAIVNVIVHDLT